MSSNNDKSGTSNKISNYEFYKQWGGWHGFMHSYGLKPWDLDDVEEGKAIRDVLKESYEANLAEERHSHPQAENKESGGSKSG